MKELLFDAATWIVKGLMGMMFVCILIICIPIAIIGDMFGESKRRIKR